MKSTWCWRIIACDDLHSFTLAWWSVHKSINNYNYYTMTTPYYNYSLSFMQCEV